MTSTDVHSVDLDFEHLALHHRTTFRWTRSSNAQDVERVEIELEREDALARDWFEPPAQLWAEFIDVLEASFPKPSPDATLEAPLDFLPRIGPAPDATTVPQQVVNTVQFLRCRIRLTESKAKRQITLEGKAALELMNFVFEFAAEFGVALPH